MFIFRPGGRVLSLAAGALVLSASCDKAPASQTARASSEAASEPSIVARVGDREITLAEVDQRALKANMAVFQQLYDARRQAIEDLLAEASSTRRRVAWGSVEKIWRRRRFAPRFQR